MEIKITSLFVDFTPELYSASITWNNARNLNTNLLQTSEARRALEEHLQGMGYDEPIEDHEALFVQLIAGDVREGYFDRIFVGYDGETYYYLGD